MRFTKCFIPIFIHSSPTIVTYHPNTSTIKAKSSSYLYFQFFFRHKSPTTSPLCKTAINLLQPSNQNQKLVSKTFQTITSLQSKTSTPPTLLNQITLLHITYYKNLTPSPYCLSKLKQIFSKCNKTCYNIV